jgi:multisubunit Na+/H+ antiporter MnhE subunit
MRAVLEIAAWWAVLVLVWLATLTSFSVEELVAAAVFALPCAYAARRGRRAIGAAWPIRPRWLRWLLGVPWAVLHDTVAVFRLAVGADRTSDDRFVELPLAKERDPDVRAGQEAMATAVLSAAPGSVVVDADEEHDRLIVHELPVGRTGLTRMVRR